MLLGEFVELFWGRWRASTPCGICFLFESTGRGVFDVIVPPPVSSQRVVVAVVVRVLRIEQRQKKHTRLC